MNADERREQRIRQDVDRHVSDIVATIARVAAEPNWNEDQRLALRVVAGRLGSRTHGTFLQEREAQRRIVQAENLIRQIAARIVNLKQAKGTLPVLMVDERTLTAARALVIHSEG